MSTRVSLSRSLFAVPVATVLVGVAWFAVAMTGWGRPTTPLGELRRDSTSLLVCALAGGLAGFLLARVLTDRRAVLVAAATVGCLPAVLRTTAIFTDAF